jgi:ATP-dependent DNA helicase RecG
LPGWPSSKTCTSVPDEAKALIVVREAGAIDNATYRELSKVDTLAASAALRRLRDAGLLAQKGRGSATYYVPTERLAGCTSLSQ